MSRVFLKDLRAQQNREFLWELKHRLPSVTAEIDALKSQPYGANWIHLRISRLLGNSGSLPSSLTNAVRQTARSGTGATVIERARSAERRVGTACVRTCRSRWLRFH